MTTFIAALKRISGRVRRSSKRLIRRLTRKAEIRLGLTISLPPFVKLVFDYKANIGEPANDNGRRKASRTA